MGDKGKGRMSQEELEEEEEKKKQVEEQDKAILRKELKKKQKQLKELQNARVKWLKENDGGDLVGLFRHLWSQSRLSGLISKIMPTVLPLKNSFSWRIPHVYGIDLWKSDSDSLNTLASTAAIPQTQKQTHHPLPTLVYQGRKQTCIAHAVYHLLMTQANIISKCQRKSPILISLYYLEAILMELEEQIRGGGDLMKFLGVLGEMGLYCIDDIEHDPKDGCKIRIKKGALQLTLFAPNTTFMITKGDRLGDEDFFSLLCDSITSYGGVLLTKPSLNTDGSQRMVQRSMSPGCNNFEEEPLYHVVYCYSSLQGEGGKLEFRCMCSSKGSIIIKNLELIRDFVVIQLNPWDDDDDEDVTKAVTSS